MNDLSSFDELARLAVALGIGLTIGLERGWKEREAPEGSRVAGWRTFGLIGFSGGVWAVVAASNLIVLGLALLGVVIVLTVANRQEPAEGDRSATTLVAAIVAFGLGALAGSGRIVEASAGAVLVTLLLSAKTVLHGWLRRLSEQEFQAVLRFLLISVVILPLLPDRSMGPFGAINPRELWTIVVLVAGLSFLGYAAIRIWGERAGAMLTAGLGGIVSSTAVALSYARRSAAAETPARLLAAGVMAATMVSTLRTMVFVALFGQGLLASSAVPLLSMIAVSGLAAWALWRKTEPAPSIRPTPIGNPLELRSALQLTAVLSVTLVALAGFRTMGGDIGLDAATGLAGTIDIDAATISICRMVETGLDPRHGTTMLLFGLVGNGLLKVAMAGVFGRRAFWLPVAIGYAATAAAGIITGFLL